jgi:hypothetical protein
MNMLTLPEELMLLALDDAQGTVIPNAQRPLRMGLVSAALTELTLSGKLRVDAQGNVIAANTAPTGNDLLDEIANRVARSQPPRPTYHWLQSLTNDLRNIEDRVRDRLVQRGVLRQEESRKFFIIREVRFPAQNGAFEGNVRAKLRDVVINNAQPDERTMALIGLVKMCDLVETVFPYTDWVQARQRIDQLTNPQYAGWQYQAQGNGYGYNQQQPMGMGGMMSGMVPALMFSMMAQSMFWGMGGWMMPGMMLGGMGGLGAPMEEGVPMDDSQMSEVNAEDGGFDGGFDFGGDFGGEF